ncbi:hypothetical protein QUF79_21915 [Fictibacillus enclensis]|uniref:hypothetical protein n=1 Tax=Fictibacillus enclensis TaxID=1017270 RepID=UPI0025A30C25|nr:hypothetical protein [Fictibacillus enclensis]MDM5200680.1 hypothetical protein [Fictibacillus enclensis]
MELQQQLSEIKKLQQQCQAEENLQLKLNWDMLEQRDGNRKEDFFHYEEGELCAFLGIYGFGSKAELCGMVLPACRRKGVFTKLLKEFSYFLGTVERSFAVPGSGNTKCTRPETL